MKKLFYLVIMTYGLSNSVIAQNLMPKEEAISWEEDNMNAPIIFEGVYEDLEYIPPTEEGKTLAVQACKVKILHVYKGELTENTVEIHRTDGTIYKKIGDKDAFIRQPHGSIEDFGNSSLSKIFYCKPAPNRNNHFDDTAESAPIELFKNDQFFSITSQTNFTGKHMYITGTAGYAYKDKEEMLTKMYNIKSIKLQDEYKYIESKKKVIKIEGSGHVSGNTKSSMVADVTSFSPTTIRKGELLTINGSGFGPASEEGSVWFVNADNAFMLDQTSQDDWYLNHLQHELDIESWSDNEIQVIVPHYYENFSGTTGSGYFKIADMNGVEIGYSLESSTSVPPLHIEQDVFHDDAASGEPTPMYLANYKCSDGFRFTIKDEVKSNDSQYKLVTFGLLKWQFAINPLIDNNIRFNWRSFDANNPSDNVNIIGHNDALPVPKIMEAGQNLGVYKANVLGDQHIKYDANIDIKNSGVSWDYSTSGDIPAGHHSFYDNFLHEMGHALGLTHYVAPVTGPFPKNSLDLRQNHTDLMYYASTNGLPGEYRPNFNTGCAIAKNAAAAHANASSNIVWDNEAYPWDSSSPDDPEFYDLSGFGSFGKALPTIIMQPPTEIHVCEGSDPTVWLKSNISTSPSTAIRWEVSVFDNWVPTSYFGESIEFDLAGFGLPVDKFRALVKGGCDRISDEALLVVHNDCNTNQHLILENVSRRNIRIYNPAHPTHGHNNEIDVYYNALGTFNLGNQINVEMSNRYGQWGSQSVIIGQVPANSGTGVINCTIPLDRLTGTNYKIRLVSTSPAITSNEITKIEICNAPPNRACPVRMEDPKFRTENDVIANFDKPLYVYPNPSVSEITINVKDDFVKKHDLDLNLTYDIEFIDLSGKVMKSMNQYQLTNPIIVSDLQPGLYFLHIVVEGSRYFEKVIIQK